MTAKPGRDEQVFIRRFVSAYENFAWAGSKIDPLDERTEGAIEALITRSDGLTMAIEHTLIEPFVGDKSDFAAFEQAMCRRIEEDLSLRVPNTGIIVYVPVGVFEGRKPAQRNLIIDSIHSWIRSNWLHLHEGMHRYPCDLAGMEPVTLTVNRTKFGHLQSDPGSVLVRRQQVTNDLDKVIEKALRKKLGKLVSTKADRHILFLERDQFSFMPDLMFTEIERQRPNFPLLERVDEIWHVESIGYKLGGHLYFELRQDGQVKATIAFLNDLLVGHSKLGLPYPL